MKIVNKNINDLNLEMNNVKIHTDEQLKMLARSINKYGFLVPVVIDEKNNVLAGKGRILASREYLDITNIPCVLASNLTEAEKQGFIIADNKLNESKWDKKTLKIALEDLQKINYNLEDVGISIDVDLSGMKIGFENKENERERTFNTYNLYDFDESKCEGNYDMPIIKPIKYIPKELLSFNNMLTHPEYEKTIHFFIDDYQFERVWNNPKEYIYKLAQYDCVLTPDFSLYSDMPIAIQVYNIYRSRLIGQLLQNIGCKVIPTISWSDERSYKFCFDGIKKGGTIAISTIGIKKKDEANKLFFKGLKEAIKRIEPKIIICYGGDVGYDFKNIKVKYFDYTTTVGKKNEK